MIVRLEGEDGGVKVKLFLSHAFFQCMTVY